MGKVQDKSQHKPGSVGTWSLKLLFGDIISSRVFARHKFAIFMIMALLISYITLKYECQTRMETIKRQQDELAIVRSESIRERSTYMSRTRESMMQHLIDSMHLDLRVQNQPPYILSYDEE